MTEIHLFLMFLLVGFFGLIVWAIRRFWNYKPKPFSWNKAIEQERRKEFIRRRLAFRNYLGLEIKEFWKCSYCNMKNDMKDKTCHYCGSPRKFKLKRG